MDPVSVVILLANLLTQVESSVRAVRAVSDLIRKAREEDREVTQDEIEELLERDDLARGVLEQAILAAEVKGG